MSKIAQWNQHGNQTTRANLDSCGLEPYPTRCRILVVKISRRTVLGAVALAGKVRGQGRGAMYGLIGKMKAVAGKRDELAQILLTGIGEMPGNLSYMVANDPKDADALWITEVWARRRIIKRHSRCPL